LLHGLCFASGLREVGLSQQAIPLAVFFFNVGVELGQLAFIGVVLGLACNTLRHRDRRDVLGHPAYHRILTPILINDRTQNETCSSRSVP